MHTSILLVALMGAAPEEAPRTPSWLTDYGQAQRQGWKEGRPLAVFLAPEKNGWQKLARDGKISSEGLKHLAEGYVCVHLDTSTEYGKKWAKEFGISSGLGVVLSDRSGEYQAYRNEGSLESSSLTDALERHNGKTVYRTSNYPPETSDVSRTAISPTIIQGRYQSYGSSSGGRACST
jgi:hypothetical protein